MLLLQSEVFVGLVMMLLTTVMICVLSIMVRVVSFRFVLKRQSVASSGCPVNMYGTLCRRLTGHDGMKTDL